MVQCTVCSVQCRSASSDVTSGLLPGPGGQHHLSHLPWVSRQNWALVQETFPPPQDEGFHHLPAHLPTGFLLGDSSRGVLYWAPTAEQHEQVEGGPLPGTDSCFWRCICPLYGQSTGAKTVLKPRMHYQSCASFTCVSSGQLLLLGCDHMQGRTDMR